MVTPTLTAAEGAGRDVEVEATNSEDDEGETVGPVDNSAVVMVEREAAGLACTSAVITARLDRRLAV